MKVSYRWLQDLASTLPETPEAAAEQLAGQGFPVEDIVRPHPALEGIRVARVLEAGKHPNADRLTLCRVDTGEGEVQVVCGAPNVRSGGLYPFVPEGGVLPGGMKIKKAKIRGELSQGMLCSERELGLGRDQGGILELPDSLEPGTPLMEALALDDATLDVEVTSNRPDLLSHLGVARELAAGGSADLELPAFPGSDHLPLEVNSTEASGALAGVEVEILDPDLCPRYMAAVVRGVTVGPSPLWLQNRLRAAGSRPINNVVDATNYILLELGQPLHAFDLQRIRGGRLEIRSARAGEAIRTLDGEDRKLQKGMLLICDGEGPAAIAGVMGGEESEVSAQTTDLLLECALFHPPSVRDTRKALGMNTDASYRFERGVDPTGQPPALERLVQLIQAVAGGTAEPAVDLHPRPWQPAAIDLRLARVEQLLGVPFPAVRLRELLTPLGFQMNGEDQGSSLQVTVPGFRARDVTREVDLIEEVARTHGYHNFPETLGAFRPGTVPDDPLLRLQDRIRDALVARGLLEAQMPAFVSEDHGGVALQNPLSAQEGFLRSRLLPGLLRRVEYNLARGVRNVRLFELGTAFFPASKGASPREESRLAVVLMGDRRPPHFSASSEPVDLWDLRGLLEELAELLGHRGGGSLRVQGGKGDPPGGPFPPSELLDEGRSFHVAPAEGGDTVGWGGVVDPAGLDLPAWAGQVLALEVILPEEATEPEPVRARSAPAFPAVDRDLALLLPLDREVEGVLERIRDSAGPLLQDVYPFDLFSGPGLPEGTHSVAFRLRFLSRDRTLTDQEVDSQVEQVEAVLREEGITVRGAA
ncbi:MAG: phenylalanine--tRNA ligase subunit beta [Gemmatimonadota bacterium]